MIRKKLNIVNKVIEKGSPEHFVSMDNDDSNDDDSGSSDDFSDREKDSNQVNLKRKYETKVITKLPKKLKITSDNDKSLYKPPTVEEINHLKETENLFHSNLFRMQIQEMLSEIRVKEKYENFINSWLEELNKFLNELKNQKEKQNHEIWLKKSNIKLPISMDKLNSKQFNFQFLKPTDKAVVIGSQSTKSMIGSFICDIMLPLPVRFFQKGDNLNLIYDQKRALYLCYIAWQMKLKNFEFSALKFNFYANNPHKPILEITPTGNFANKLKFRIFAVPNTNDFKLNRFIPWNNNIRSSLFSEINHSEDEVLTATPNYNCNVLFDMTMKHNENLIHCTIASCKNIRDGLILLKIWLKQRQLNDGFVGFSNFMMNMLLVALVKQRKIHLSMSSYQVARNVWNYLASSSWNEINRGITMCTDISDTNIPTLEQMHGYYDVVFVDPSGYYNICGNLSLDNYLRVKYEATRAIELLNNHNINSFQQLFMTKFRIHTQFDNIFGLTNSNQIDKILEKYGKKSEVYNYAGYWYPILQKIITKVLRKGLNERIVSLTPLEVLSESWNCDENPTEIKKTLKFGLLLNATTAYEVLDKGPEANEPNAKEFREFWGKKSELRRFQDGSIAEACVWSSVNEMLIEKRLIVKKIITHLMEHHFGINKLAYLANDFDIVYKLNNNYTKHNHHEINNAENTSLQVIQAFDDISKKLRSLIELPLEINGVLGTSSVFRYCDPVPLLNDAKVYNDNGKTIFKAHKVLNGIIQLGVSGKWPNDLNALRSLKTAFHIQIAQLLSTKYKLRTRGSIDGVYLIHNGYVFCLEIAHLKEIPLLKKEVKEKNIIELVDTPESMELEKRINILPKFTSSLHGLYQNHQSFGPTVMIAKRWLNAQLIDSALWPDECTEIIIASQFLKQNALSVTCQPQIGFLRFLEILSSTNWKTEFIFLNFSDQCSKEELNELESKFLAERETFPALFLATSYDQNKSGIWSKNSPNIHILARVKMLAQQTLTILEPCFQFESPINLNSLFTPSMEGYDVLIHLKANVIPSCAAYDFNSKNNFSKLPLANFNAVEIGLNELREGYSEFAIFFYNKYGGKTIAVLWKPEIHQIKEFKLNSVNGCQVKDSNQLQCNVNVLIEDFKIILNGLYSSIEIVR